MARWVTGGGSARREGETGLGDAFSERRGANQIRPEKCWVVARCVSGVEWRQGGGVDRGMLSVLECWVEC